MEITKMSDNRQSSSVFFKGSCHCLTTIWIPNLLQKQCKNIRVQFMSGITFTRKLTYEKCRYWSDLEQVRLGLLATVSCSGDEQWSSSSSEESPATAAPLTADAADEQVCSQAQSLCQLYYLRYPGNSAASTTRLMVSVYLCSSGMQRTRRGWGPMKGRRVSSKIASRV